MLKGQQHIYSKYGKEKNQSQFNKTSSKISMSNFTKDIERETNKSSIF